MGGSVDVKVGVDGVIDKITTHAQTNCGNGAGVGTSTFYTYCGCTGSCSITGSWDIIYKRT